MIHCYAARLYWKNSSFILFLLIISIVVSSSSSSSTSSPPASSTSSSSRDALEAARYGTLPPIVFAPGGRLHGVERVAMEAYPPGEDELSCVVIALRCGGGDRGGGRDFQGGEEADEGREGGGYRIPRKSGEFAILAGIGTISPFLHRDEAYLGETRSDAGEQSGYMPLVLDSEECGDPDLPPTPIAILSPTLVAGVGGKGIDSAVLLRRTVEVALSMYRSDNGGVEWFMSHSMEGTTRDPTLTPVPLGGAAGVEVSSLARRVADMAQSSTQSLGGRYGRMLSSSLLAVGVRNNKHQPNPIYPQNNKHDNNIDDSDNDRIAIWRVDPTGQFWRLDAAAVGRGAIDVESELLSKVKHWIESKKQNEPRDESELDKQQSSQSVVRRDSELTSYNSNVSNKDVREYLGSLNEDQAFEVASDCLIKGIMRSMRHNVSLQNNDKTRRQIEIGLRKRINAVFVRSSQIPLSRPYIDCVLGHNS